MPRPKKTTSPSILEMEKSEGDIIRSMIQSACDESKKKVIEESHHQSNTVLLEDLGDLQFSSHTLKVKVLNG